jgi:hypothetical protein
MVNVSTGIVINFTNSRLHLTYALQTENSVSIAWRTDIDRLSLLAPFTQPHFLSLRCAVI